MCGSGSGLWTRSTRDSIAWREGKRAPGLFIELDEDDDRCQVTVKDHSMSLTTVTVTVPLADVRFDEAYRQMELVWETWPMSEG
ncbi:DUF5959 family protein [Streptomyces sp. NPDC026666]|uniref:DUF5959 family protein n=1 Tax=Streptomyces sp. NPDC026666 TaxID=3154799 RepID=UPI0034565AA0